MKRKNNYNSFRFFDVLKRLILFCLLLSMMAKPVVSNIFHIADIEYELCESYEEMDSEEKEDITDSEEEDQKHHYNISDFKFHFKYNFSLSLFTLQKDHISSQRDIPFPPPKRS